MWNSWSTGQNVLVLFLCQESCVPERVGLYLAIYVPRWLSQLDSLPLATREKQSRGKCLVWKWLFVFRWANFSPGASNLWLCLKERQKGDGEDEEGSRLLLDSVVSSPCGQSRYLAWFAVTSGEVTGMVLSYRRKGWWSPHDKTTSCPSALARACFGHNESEKNLVAGSII